VQADTVVPSPANPQTLNRYAYTLNNPLKYTDPSGHVGVLAGLAIAAAIGFVANTGVQVYKNISNEGMNFTDAVMNVDIAQAGGAAAGAVVATGTAALALAAVPIAVGGLGLSGTAGVLGTVALSGAATGGASVVGAAFSDFVANDIRGVAQEVGLTPKKEFDPQFFQSVSLSEYQGDAALGGALGIVGSSLA
jgi:hypothetical protein